MPEILRVPPAPAPIRPCLGFALAVAGIGLSSLLIYGWALHEAWFTGCIQPYAGKALSGMNVQSLTSFLARLYGGNILDWVPRSIPGSFPFVQRGLSLVLLATVAWIMFRAGRPRDHRELGLEIGIVLVFVLVFSPLSWTHYYLFGLFPLMLLASGTVELPPGPAWRAVAALAVLVFSMPLMGFIFAQPWLSFLYSRIVSSYHFYGALLLLALLLALRLRQAAGPPAPAGPAGRA